MRPTKKPTLRQQLDALLEDISDRGREVMIMADLWREERIKSKKLVEALGLIKNCSDSDYEKTTTDDGEEEYWISNNEVQMICDYALAEYKKETE